MNPAFEKTFRIGGSRTPQHPPRSPVISRFIRTLLNILALSEVTFTITDRLAPTVVGLRTFRSASRTPTIPPTVRKLTMSDNVVTFPLPLVQLTVMEIVKTTGRQEPTAPFTVPSRPKNSPIQAPFRIGYSVITPPAANVELTFIRTFVTGRTTIGATRIPFSPRNREKAIPPLSPLTTHSSRTLA